VPALPGWAQGWYEDEEQEEGAEEEKKEEEEEERPRPRSRSPTRHAAAVTTRRTSVSHVDLGPAPSGPLKLPPNPYPYVLPVSTRVAGFVHHVPVLEA
jgi:hypothetical protein